MIVSLCLLLQLLLSESDSHVASDVEMETPDASLDAEQNDFDYARNYDPEESLDPVSPYLSEDENLSSVSESPAHTNSPQQSLAEDEADYEIESPPKSPKQQKSVSFFLVSFA